MSEELMKQIINRLDQIDTRLNEKFDAVNDRLDRMEARQKAIAEQTAKISEYHSETIARIDRIEKQTNENAEDIGYLVRDMYRIKHRKNG